MLRVQDCRLPAFKPLSSPQRPYMLSCWGFKTAGCQPSNASTLRSGPARAFKPLNAPQRPYTVSCWGFKAAFCGETLCSGPSYAVCRPSNASTVRSGPTQSVVGGSRMPFASLQTYIQTVEPSTAAMHTVLLRLQDCHLPAFKPLNAPQRPYTLSCWRFKAAVCEPPNPLRNVLLGLQECRLPGFKPLNAPQRPCTVFCWGFYSRLPVASLQTRPLLGCYAVCLPSDASIVHSGPTHSVVGGSRVPFASL